LKEGGDSAELYLCRSILYLEVFAGGTMSTGFFYGRLPRGKFCAKVERKEGQELILAYLSPLKTERNVEDIV
jgi:hypothetical protein